MSRNKTKYANLFSIFISVSLTLIITMLSLIAGCATQTQTPTPSPVLPTQPPASTPPPAPTQQIPMDDYPITRATTFVVAAQDSSLASKAQADYVGDGTDDQVQIQAAIDALPSTGGKVVLADGTFIISKGITARDNLTLEFVGKIRLADNGVMQHYMIFSDHENVRIINPRLDGDRDNNIVNPRPGTQALIRFRENSQNNTVIGGLLENAPRVGIMAHSRNLKISGTTMKNLGEHGVYVSGRPSIIWASDIYIDSVAVYYPGLSGYGYGFKMDRVRNGNIRSSHVVFTGTEGYSTIGVVYVNGSQGGTAELRVENADYGVQITGKDGTIPNRGISLSLDLQNCEYFAALPQSADDAIYTRVFNSNMDTGHFLPNAFGEHAVIENVHASHLYAPAGYNVEYTVRGSRFAGESQYTLDLRSGHDVIIEDCEFENTHPDRQLGSVQNITGMFSLKDSVFKGGKDYSLRLDPASGPTDIINITGNTFSLPSGTIIPRVGLDIATTPPKHLYLANNRIARGLWRGFDRPNVIAFEKHSETFVDVLGEDANMLVAAQDLTATAPIICTTTGQPDVPRNVTIAVKDTDASIKAFTIAVTGVNAKGNSVTEYFNAEGGLTQTGNEAFAIISGVEITSVNGANAEDVLNIGIDSKLGISNVIYASEDVYKVRKNQANYARINYTVNTTYDTIDVSTGEAINDGDDFTIYYRSNLNIIS